MASKDSIPNGDTPARFKPEEIVLADVTLEDLPQIAEGFYATFPESMHEKWEPPATRPSQLVRLARKEKLLSGWLSIPTWRWRKAVLASDRSKIIGHAGWQLPSSTPGGSGRPAMNIWRYAAIQALGIQKSMNWTDDEVAEMFAAVDLQHWEGEFKHFDDVRAKVMGEEPHWFLAPLWVMPEFWGRGVAGMLLREVMEEADKVDPPTPMYLEASPQGRPVYEHLGWRGLDGEGMEHTMLRRGPMR